MLCLFGAPQIAKSQSCNQISASDLRRIFVELGYDVKDLNTEIGKEKFEIKLSTQGLQVPMGVEISPSKNYIWLTVNLGPAFEESSPRNFALLKRNSIIQPAHFYITEKGTMMMALAIENKCITNSTLKKFSDSFANKVAENKVYWQKN